MRRWARYTTLGRRAPARASRTLDTKLGTPPPHLTRRVGSEDNDQACMQMPGVRSDFAQIITPVVRAGRGSLPPLRELRALKTGPP